MADFFKDPSDVLDYAVDWSRYLLDDETITASAWAVTGPDSSLVVIRSSEFTEKKTRIWVSVGTAGKLYTLTNTVTTSSSPTARVYERSLTILVKNL